MHQTIIKSDEISPFTVNIILCHHYCGIVAIKELCREWHDGVVQYACRVSESECLPLSLPQAPANKYVIVRPLLPSIPRRLFCSDSSFNLSSKNDVHTFIKARLHADCQYNTTANQGFLATDDRVCFLGQDTML